MAGVALALADGELVRVALKQLGLEQDLTGQFGCPPADLAAAQATVLDQRLGDLVANADIGSNGLPCMASATVSQRNARSRSEQFLLVEQHFAARLRWLDQPGQAQRQRRLSGSAFPTTASV